MQCMFKKRDNIRDVEEGKYLSPKFDENGLIPVITTDFQTGGILMHGYMNDEALKKTIETKEVHYWSRSRKKLWRKGQISGFVQIVKEIRIDDDQDSVWLSVDIGNGASCHVGYRSCFYRSIPLGKIKNGVDFFQTQYVLEAKKLEEYMKVLEDAGILEKTSFLIGLGPFASVKSAKWMNDNLFGVDVPDEIIKRLEQAKDQKEESKKICLELIKIFREIKGVKGIHLMGHKKEEVIAEIIKESKAS